MFVIMYMEEVLTIHSFQSKNYAIIARNIHEAKPLLRLDLH
jgi:hypothetical protein